MHNVAHGTNAFATRCVQVSEVDGNGNLISTFTDVLCPYHLSADKSGRVLVADRNQDCILVLDSQLHLDRILVDKKSQSNLRCPERLHLNELTSELYVVHHTDELWASYVITQWSV